MPIDLMPQITQIAGIPGFSIATSTVTISVVKEDQETYPLSGFGSKDANKKQLFALRKRGVLKFVRAAGIKIVGSKVWRPEPRIPQWQAEWLGKYMEPDGSWSDCDGDKEWDLTIGGTRWNEICMKQLDTLLIDEGKKTLKLEWKRGMQATDYATLVKRQITTERLEEFTDIAEARATRHVIRQAQYGAEMASTGAMLRGIMRIMNLKHAYTAKEYAEGFVVSRTNVNYEQMKSLLGEKAANARIAAMLDQALSLEPGRIQQLLSAATKTDEVLPEEPPEDQGFMTSVAEELEGEIVEPPAEPCKAPKPKGDFAKKVEPELAEWIEANAKAAFFPNTDGLVGYLMGGRPIPELSHGEACNLRRFMEGIISFAGEGKAIGDINTEKGKLKQVLTRCNAENRLWSAEEQLELPETSC